MDTATTPTLDDLGLRAGDRVRWRSRTGGRWQQGTVVTRERDGSVGLSDANGASRAIVIDRLQVRDRGPRGGVIWMPLASRTPPAQPAASTSPESSESSKSSEAIETVEAVEAVQGVDTSRSRPAPNENPDDDAQQLSLWAPA